MSPFRKSKYESKLSKFKKTSLLRSSPSTSMWIKVSSTKKELEIMSNPLFPVMRKPAFRSKVTSWISFLYSSGTSKTRISFFFNYLIIFFISDCATLFSSFFCLLNHLFRQLLKQVGGREKHQQKSSPMVLKPFQTLLFHEFASIFFQRIFHIHNTNLAAHIHFQILFQSEQDSIYKYVLICN